MRRIVLELHKHQLNIHICIHPSNLVVGYLPEKICHLSDQLSSLDFQVRTVINPHRVLLIKANSVFDFTVAQLSCADMSAPL